jgi:hypothetical protein
MPTYYASGVTLFSISNLIAQPFVLLKRRRQISSSSGAFVVGVRRDVIVVVSPPHRHRHIRGGDGGTLRAIADIAREEGIGGLFRSGRIAWIAGVSRMMYFASYERIVDSLLARHGDDDGGWHGRMQHQHVPSWVCGFAGGTSTVVSQLVMTPYSIVSGRLQIETGRISRASSATSVLRDVVSGPRGMRSLWTGYVSAIMQLGPQHAAMWAVTGMMRDAMIEHLRRRSCGAVRDESEEEGGHVDDYDDDDDDDDVDLGLLPRLATSACGSAVAIVITSPLDVVRTHRQAMAASGPSTSPLGGGGTMPSSWEVVVGLYRRGGTRALFGGIVPRMYANCPGMIAMMVGYQYVKELAAGVERWRLA